MNHRKTILQALAIVVGSAVIAVVFNAVRAEGIPLVAPDRAATVSETPDEPGLGNVDLAGAKKLYDSGAVFFDARSEHEFAEGHIAGALNLYYADFDEKGPNVLANVPLDKTVVTYCSGEDCHASDMLARDLSEYGFERVRIFFAGWPAWEAASYPTEGVGGGDTSLFVPMGGHQ